MTNPQYKIERDREREMEKGKSIFLNLKMWDLQRPGGRLTKNIDGNVPRIVDDGDDRVHFAAFAIFMGPYICYPIAHYYPFTITLYLSLLFIDEKIWSNRTIWSKSDLKLPREIQTRPKPNLFRFEIDIKLTH